MNAPIAKFEIVYNGRNITGDISRYATGISYTDKSKHDADEIEISLQDINKLWQNEWYPTKGDKVSCIIFFLGQSLACGTFTIDEIISSSDSDGDKISIKGIAAGIDRKIRTKATYAHENKTLREIANTIASKHGLTVDGKIEDIRIGRETQFRETDLHFLQRLASEYGYVFSIRDTKLVFTNIFEIEGKSAALTIKRSEITSFSITDKTSKTYKAVKISYHNPQDKKVIDYSKTETDGTYKDAKGDTLVINLRAENKQQAERKSIVALYNANSLQQEGSVEMPGNIYALAGNNCELQGIGVMSGKYYIDSSTHSVDKDGGYTTSIQVKRVGLIDKSKHK
jgi:phage protein D